MSVKNSATVACDIKDLSLAEAGKRRLEWAFSSMSVLQEIRKHLIKTQLFAHIRLAACLPVTAETANLLITMRDGGAEVVLCAARAASVEDDIAASLVKDYALSVFALKGEDDDLRTSHLKAALERSPHLLLDNNGELTATLIAEAGPETVAGVLGAIVETREGSHRLRLLAREGVLPFPVFAMNSARVRHLFHSRYGTGQSTMDAIIHALNILIAGMNVVVVGFGAAGRGIAARAKGLGANVLITEVDPLRAVEAVMEGYRVLAMSEAASLGDIFITVSGNRTVIGREHFDKLRNGAVLCNAGHSDVEIDLSVLAQISNARRRTREGVEEIVLRDGRRIVLLSEGRSIHLGAGEGHPASVLDLSFANQALSAEYLLKHHSTLEKAVHSVPVEIDRQVAKLKLESIGVKIDRLTVEQEQYMATWSEGL